MERTKLDHSCPDTMKKKIMAMGKAERGSRDRGSDMITKSYLGIYHFITNTV